MAIAQSTRSLFRLQSWKDPKSFGFLLALLMILGGFGLRMIDLTDPPLDFHPSRQLFSYTIARGLYYQLAPQADPEIREQAISAGEATDRYEPRIQEGILALIYLLTGGERFWVARIFTSFIWLFGGWILFKLAIKVSSPAGGLFSLGYYLFLPFSIQASRSFQPDVLMVVGIIATAFSLYRWSEARTWKWSLIVGFVGGFTVLLKAQGIFAVAAMSLITTIFVIGLNRAIRDLKIWTMAAIMISMPAIYYLGPWVSGGGAYFANFTVAMSRLLNDPAFFVYWANFIHDFMDMGVIVVAVLGTFLMNKRGRPVAMGLWLGYALLGFFFPWQIHTHDYYSLSLIPTVAFGLAPIGSWMVDAIRKENWFWKAAFIAVALFAIAYPAWTARSALLGKDYRNEPGAWRNMGRELPRDGNIIALTHDYGWRLQYWGYTPVSLWPYTADNELHLARGGNLGEELEPFFETFTDRYDYFLVTAYGEFDSQVQLKEILEQYPIKQRGDGYILYDLNER